MPQDWPGGVFECKKTHFLPQIFADERRLNKREELPELFVLPGAQEVNAGKSWAANLHEKPRIAFVAEGRAFERCGGWTHGPPEWARAA
jgi:hypothetical protein